MTASVTAASNGCHSLACNEQLDLLFLESNSNDDCDLDNISDQEIETRIALAIQNLDTSLNVDDTRRQQETTTHSAVDQLDFSSPPSSLSPLPRFSLMMMDGPAPPQIGSSSPTLKSPTMATPPLRVTPSSLSFKRPLASVPSSAPPPLAHQKKSRLSASSTASPSSLLPALLTPLNDTLSSELQRIHTLEYRTLTLLLTRHPDAVADSIFDLAFAHLNFHLFHSRQLWRLYAPDHLRECTDLREISAQMFQRFGIQSSSCADDVINSRPPLQGGPFGPRYQGLVYARPKNSQDPNSDANCFFDLAFVSHYSEQELTSLLSSSPELADLLHSPHLSVLSKTIDEHPVTLCVGGFHSPPLTEAVKWFVPFVTLWLRHCMDVNPGAHPSSRKRKCIVAKHNPHAPYSCLLPPKALLAGDHHHHPPQLEDLKPFLLYLQHHLFPCSNPRRGDQFFRPFIDSFSSLIAPFLRPEK